MNDIKTISIRLPNLLTTDPKKIYNESAPLFSINLYEGTISKLSFAQKVSIFFDKLEAAYQNQGCDPYDIGNESLTVNPFFEGLWKLSEADRGSLQEAIIQDGRVYKLLEHYGLSRNMCAIFFKSLRGNIACYGLETFISKLESGVVQSNFNSALENMAYIACALKSTGNTDIDDLIITKQEFLNNVLIYQIGEVLREVQSYPENQNQFLIGSFTNTLTALLDLFTTFPIMSDTSKETIETFVFALLENISFETEDTFFTDTRMHLIKDCISFCYNVDSIDPKAKNIPFLISLILKKIRKDEALKNSENTNNTSYIVLHQLYDKVQLLEQLFKFLNTDTLSAIDGEALSMLIMHEFLQSLAEKIPKDIHTLNCILNMQGSYNVKEVCSRVFALHKSEALSKLIQPEHKPALSNWLFILANDLVTEYKCYMEEFITLPPPESECLTTPQERLIEVFKKVDQSFFKAIEMLKSWDVQLDSEQLSFLSKQNNFSTILREIKEKILKGLGLQLKWDASKNTTNESEYIRYTEREEEIATSSDMHEITFVVQNITTLIELGIKIDFSDEINDFGLTLFKNLPAYFKFNPVNDPLDVDETMESALGMLTSVKKLGFDINLSRQKEKLINILKETACYFLYVEDDYEDMIGDYLSNSQHIKSIIPPLLALDKTLNCSEEPMSALEKLINILVNKMNPVVTNPTLTSEALELSKEVGLILSVLSGTIGVDIQNIENLLQENLKKYLDILLNDKNLDDVKEIQSRISTLGRRKDLIPFVESSHKVILSKWLSILLEDIVKKYKDFSETYAAYSSLYENYNRMEDYIVICNPNSERNFHSFKAIQILQSRDIKPDFNCLPSSANKDHFSYILSELQKIFDGFKENRNKVSIYKISNILQYISILISLGVGSDILLIQNLCSTVFNSLSSCFTIDAMDDKRGEKENMPAIISILESIKRFGVSVELSNNRTKLQDILKSLTHYFACIKYSKEDNAHDNKRKDISVVIKAIFNLDNRLADDRIVDALVKNILQLSQMQECSEREEVAEKIITETIDTLFPSTSTFRIR